MHILFTLKAAGSFWLHSSKLTKNTMVSEVYSKRGKKKVILLPTKYSIVQATEPQPGQIPDAGWPETSGFIPQPT